MPRSKRSTSAPRWRSARALPARGVGPERADRGDRDGAPVAAGADRRCVPRRGGRAGRRQGQQAHPRDESRRRPELRVGHRVDDVARARRPPCRRRSARPGRSTWTSSDDGAIGALPGVDQLVERSGDRRAPRRPACPAAARRGPARPSGTTPRLGPAELRLQDPVGDLPALERVELDRDGVLEVAGLVAQRDAEPLAQEGPDRVAQEALELVEADGSSSVTGGSGSARNGGGVVARASVRPGRRPGAGGRSSTGRRAPSSPCSKLRGSKGWSGCATTMASRARPARGAHGVVDHVEQLADRHRRRAVAGWSARRGPSR